MARVTSDDVQEGVDLALRAAHSRMHEVGRPLHPVETRWTVRHAFRARYCGLCDSVANRHADNIIEVIEAIQVIGG